MAVSAVAPRAEAHLVPVFVGHARFQALATTGEVLVVEAFDEILVKKVAVVGARRVRSWLEAGVGGDVESHVISKD